MTLYQVDAFTDQPFAGNPAAVTILSEPRDAAWMQAVALEMNLSETAFLVRNNEGFDLRWFTPAVEVDLCGHATLASAHVLWEIGELAPDETAVFMTRSGRLTATKRGDWIELDFPSEAPSPVEAPLALIEGLGIDPVYVGANRMDMFVEMEDETALRVLQPDLSKLKTLPYRGIIVTAKSSGEYDFISRFFGPAAGVDEDPVTGSAHCCLAPYWAAKLGKPVLKAFQASARGGFVEVEPREDRVLLRGKAVTVLEATLVAGG